MYYILNFLKFVYDNLLISYDKTLKTMKQFTRLIRNITSNMKLFPFVLAISLIFIIGCEKENNLPTCEITSPENGDEYEVGDIITISVDAEDTDGTIEEVKFYISDTEIGSSNSYPYSHEWDTNDEDEGEKEIKVIAKDDRGGTEEDEITILLIPKVEPPVAAFSVDTTSITEGDTVYFTDESTNSPTSWDWDFGDGSTSTEQNPSHTYSSAGSYTVRLTVTNSVGSDSETKTNYITVNSEIFKPVAAFTASPTTIIEEGAVQFTDQSTNEPTEWSWDFGDGSTSTEQNPNHSYTNEGTYDVSLTVTNSAGSDSETKTDMITVTPSDITGQTGTLTDIEGNTYNWIGIGTQAWMAENLKTTKYYDGTAIPLVTDGTEWDNLTTPGYCWYNNDETSYKDTYGALYNYHTVNTDKLCPAGWHVPTDAEWTELENYLIANGYNYDGSTTGYKAGKSLAATSGWNSSISIGDIGNDQQSNNSTGFTALPGGYRTNVGPFGGEGLKAYFWSSTAGSSSSAWSRGLYYDYEFLFLNYGSKVYGFSVRCVRD
jgi:uncharacterized protein (TIGR02145 family)